MAGEINTGGPAFPQNDLSAYGMGPSQTCNEGMTLRDWFAGQAASGDMASMKDEALPSSMTLTQFWRERAEFYYMVADAMLEAREAKP